MPLDINDFRVYKGGNPDKIKESQRRRFAPVEAVDEIIALDEDWRKYVTEVDKTRGVLKKLSTEIGKMKKAGENADEKMAEVSLLKKSISDLESRIEELRGKIDVKVSGIGNYVADDVTVSADEKDNKIVSSWGECAPKGDKLFHHELLWMIGGYEPEQGSKVAGARGYFLKGVGVLLNQALINYGLAFLMKKGCRLRSQCLWSLTLF
jgi:seryl-tRNA synthetase